MDLGKFQFHLLNLLKMVGLLLGLATALSAGDFAAPAEGPLAFRRDRLPLDVETMADLSAQLAILADGLDPQTAPERRGAAQILALSLALDPGNSRARNQIDHFTTGKHKRAADTGKMEKSRAALWQIIGWLDTPEAGTQGKALAACLKDVLVISDPKDPRGESIRDEGERGAWAGWIPPLAKYEKVSAPADDTPVEAPSVELALANARVSAVLFKTEGVGRAAKVVPFTASVGMSAEKAMDAENTPLPFSITFGTREVAALAEPWNATLLRLLEKKHTKLPAGIHVTIAVDDAETLAPGKNTQSLGAVAGILASAAITGQEPDATVIGTLDEAGIFKMPADLWSQLRSLGKGKGGRLVLPAEAAELLPSMLAMEQPQFFFEYEVVLAANFGELLEASAKTPEGPLAKVSNQFRELREKSVSQPVGPYVGNIFIRRRLLEIAQEFPNHYSARMLAIQGSGSRPVFVPRTVLISELRRAIEPMTWIVKHGSSVYQPAEAGTIGTTYETCRSAVDGLFRYTDKGDRDLLSSVQELVAKLRPLDRAISKGRNYYETVDPIQAAQTAVVSAYAQVSQQLGLGGEAEPVR